MNNCFSGTKEGRTVAKEYYKKLEALVEKEYEESKRISVEGWSEEEVAFYNAELKEIIRKKYENRDIASLPL
jgi:hypothetical protein